jgi:hypothetical protein
MKLRIYVAGPMRGYEQFNFPAFAEAAATLREDGWEVISPHELDELDGFNPERYSAAPPDLQKMAQIQLMQRDLDALKMCAAIALLPGWEKSRGATCELAFARFCDLECYRYVEGRLTDLED